jgi:uncharacterized protein YkwD
MGSLAVVAAAVVSWAGAEEPADPIASALFSAHNHEREQEGRRPLKLSSQLCASAATQARDMAAHGKLQHAGSDGSTVAQRVKRQAYPYVRVGENIAEGQKTVEQIMKTWMKSPGHRENILADFTEMGAARAEDDKGKFYWCVNFGTPMPRLKAEEAASAVVRQINRDRTAGKQAALKVDPALGRAAMVISAKMASKESLEIGGDPFALIGAKAMEGREVGLKLSANVPTAEQAAKELVGDEGKELSPYQQVGVGYAIAKSGTPYWCAIFARPLPPRPPGLPRKTRSP